MNVWWTTGARADRRVSVVAGTPGVGVATEVGGCPGTYLWMADPKLLGSTRADAGGLAFVTQGVPSAAAGVTLRFQAVDHGSCTVSDVLDETF